MYLAIFNTVSIPTESEEEEFGFELVLSRPVYSYIKVFIHKQIILLINMPEKNTFGNTEGKGKCGGK